MARFTIQTPDGPKRKTIYGKAYKEVEAALAKARGDAARGLTFDACTLTVGEWLDRWLRDAVADTVRPVTFAKYEQIVHNHAKLVQELLGHTTISIPPRYLQPRAPRHGRRACRRDGDALG